MTLKLIGIILILGGLGSSLVLAARLASESRYWVLGGIAAAVGLGGLLVAGGSGADERFLHYGGLALFVVGVLAVFYLEKRGFDEAERRRNAPAGAAAPGSRPFVVAKATKNAIAIALLLVALGTVAFHFLSPWWWTPIASNWGYVDDTILITFWITGIVFIAIIVFVAYCVFRYWHQEGRRSAYEPENPKLEWWLTGLTTLGVAGMLTPGLFVWDQFVTVPKDASEVEVLAKQWQFAFRLPGKDGVLGVSDARLVSAENPFGLDPKDPKGHDDILVDGGDLHLPLNKPVKVLLRSIDVLHNFYVPEFRAKMDMVPGMVTYYWLTPTRTGTFDGLCFELCGIGHYAMRIKVVVEEDVKYQAWLSEQPTFARLLAQAGSVKTRN
jgi:cytochrome c oxidase subunit 2